MDDFSTIAIATLIIEHNVGMRGNFRNMLTQCGINIVQSVGTAAAAIRKLQERPFDLILCEYHLGEGQDGQHFLEDLRNHHLIPLSTIFIMITGESSYERVVSAVELAPNDYILKPFAADTLYQRIERALEKRDAMMPAYSLIEIGDLQGAVRRCTEGERRFPQHVIDFMRLQAQLLVAMGQPDEAQEVYRRVLEARALPWAKLGIAKTLFMQKEFADAEESLEELVSENPQYLDAYDWLARTHEAAGHMGKAQHTLEQAVSMSPHTLRRLKRLGDIAIETGDTAVAERTLTEVVRKGKYSDFRDPEDHVKLVKVFVAKGDREQAERTIRDLDRTMQGMEKTEACSALSSAMVLTQAGESEKALEAINRAVAATKNKARLSDSAMIDLAKTCLENQNEAAAADVMGDVMRNASSEAALEKAKGIFEQAGLKTVGDELARCAKQEVVDMVAAGAKSAENGDFEGAVKLMLEASAKLPGNIHVGFNAALALIKHVEHRGWNADFAARARVLIDIGRQADPANQRIAALSSYYQSMLVKYGIQPGKT